MKKTKKVVSRDRMTLSLTNSLVSTQETEEKKERKNKKKIENYLPDLGSVTSYTSEMLSNNDDILLLFPDIDLSMEVVTSSIISPMDVLKTKISYSNDISYITTSLKHNLLEMTEKHIKKYYNYESLIHTIVKESLFTKGSFIRLIVPDNIVKNMVNYNTTISGNEEYILNLKKKQEDKIIVTDDLTYLNVGNYNDTIVSGNEERVDDLTIIFKNLENLDNVDTFTFNQTSEDSIGIPTLIKIPVTSFVPVHLRNDNTKIIGGFILVDETGTPIKEFKKVEKESEITSELIIEDNILNKVKTELYAKSKKAPDLNAGREVFDKLISDLTLDILKSKHIESYSSIEDIEIIKEIMFSRLLRNQKTRVIFVPSKYLEMYTINYRSNGTGESLIERIRVLSSIRAILLFTKLAAITKNAIPTTKITLDIDDDDIDPEKTRDRIIAEFIKGKQLEVPIGLQTINDLSSWIHKFGYFFEVNNANIPKIGLSFDDTNRNIQVPDESMEEEIRKRTILTLGTTPELVDAAFENDFATTTLLSNVISAKRYQRYQDSYNNLLSLNVRKILKVDGIYKEEFIKLLKPSLNKILTNIKKIYKNQHINESTIAEKIINDFINILFLSLPEIKTSDDTKLSDAFDDYTSKLDDAINSYISSDFINSDTASDLGDNIDTYKNVIKATMIRNWCIKNDYYPELNDMVTITDDNKFKLNLMEEHVDHIERLMEALKDPLKRDKKVKKKITKTYEKIESDSDEDPEDNYNSDNTEKTQIDDNKQQESSKKEPTNNDQTERVNNDAFSGID